MQIDDIAGNSDSDARFPPLLFFSFSCGSGDFLSAVNDEIPDA